MAHYARLDENNKVVSVHSVNDSDEIVNGVFSEANGIAYLTKVHGWTKWKKTSYNTRKGKYVNHDGSIALDQSKALRYNFAGINCIYDETADAFIPPKDFDSWILDTTTYTWKAPIEKPSSQTNGIDDLYNWNESTKSWDKEVIYRA